MRPWPGGATGGSPRVLRSVAQPGQPGGVSHRRGGDAQVDVAAALPRRRARQDPPREPGLHAAHLADRIAERLVVGPVDQPPVLRRDVVARWLPLVAATLDELDAVVVEEDQRVVVDEDAALVR